MSTRDAVAAGRHVWVEARRPLDYAVSIRRQGGQPRKQPSVAAPFLTPRWDRVIVRQPLPTTANHRMTIA